jgi:hypothetical protein
VQSHSRGNRGEGMGVLYSIVPLDDSIAPYLRDLGVTFSDSGIPGRNPTPLELRTIASELTDLSVELPSPPEEAWQIMIQWKTDPENEPWTLLNVTDFTGDETVPHAIWFEKGWPSLILRVVHLLSFRCGPLVVFPDTGCEPIVVSANDDVRQLLANWEHVR